MLRNRPHIAGILLALAAGTLWGIGLGIVVASVTLVYLRETRQYATAPPGVRTE